MGKTNIPPSFHSLVLGGLVAGYLYAILLSASSIVVCESKRSSGCEEVWNRGYSTATGLVTTFLAYLVPPGSIAPASIRKKKEETDASP